jgi:L-ascorbate metabolism protein UlaG (beta-lactamase superfamily)
MRKFFKRLIAALAILIAVVIACGAVFMYSSPHFGAPPGKTQQEKYVGSSQFKNGVFNNSIPTSLDMGFANTLKIAYRFFFNNAANLEPSGPIPMVDVDSSSIVKNPGSLTRLTWFGHSACLLEIEGKRILFDPMLGPSPAPHPWLGPKRFTKKPPITVEELPPIDVVVLSHDHYDHLDYESIMILKEKTGHFYMPLGVGAHLRSWGVDSAKITELDWWEQAESNGFTFTCTPARHFSGRGLTDRFKTLWSSWIVKTESRNLYFSGDGGYGPHFSEIGEKYGPFDFVMLECGQYNELWKDIHMMPEETVQAARDLKGKVMMPIHWGAFALALHEWTDPINRVVRRAEQLEVPLVAPVMGEPIVLNDTIPNLNKWWK